MKDTGDVEQSLLTLVSDVPFDMKALLLAKEKEDNDRVGATKKRRKRFTPNNSDVSTLVDPDAPASVSVRSTRTPITTSTSSGPKCPGLEPKGIVALSAGGSTTDASDTLQDSPMSPLAPSISPRHTNAFLQQILKPSQCKFLLSISINTADELIRADKTEQSNVVQELARWRRERGFREIGSSSLVRAVSQWTSKVQVELDAMEERQNQKERIDGIMKTSPRKKKKKARRKVPKKFDAESGVDPIEALSDKAKQFLRAEGITTAQQFLSRKTSDLTSAYIAWRERQGLNALKGYGAVSIMSGWKGTVRDTCKAIGKDELVQIDTFVRKRSKQHATPMRTHAVTGRESNNCAEDLKVSLDPAKSSCIDKMCIELEESTCARPDILNGLPSRAFTVCSYDKGEFFLLALRLLFPSMIPTDTYIICSQF